MEDKAQKTKEERTREKVSVTNAAKRLTGAIDRNAGGECIKQFMLDLEKAMAEFQIVHDNYCEIVESDASLDRFKVVNGLDLNQYEESVKTVYCSASNQYKDYECANPPAVKTASITLMTKLETYQQRLHDLCRKAEEDCVRNVYITKPEAYDTMWESTEIMARHIEDGARSSDVTVEMMPLYSFGIVHATLDA